MTEEVEALKRTISERDAMIVQLKNKTKEFVTKLKEDNAIALSKLEVEHKANVKTQLEELKVKFKKSYDTALANHGEEITKLKGSHESSIADLRGQIEQLTAAQAAAGAAQEDSSSAALAALQKECDELKATNSTLQGEVQSYKEKAQAAEEEKTKFATENEARQDEFCKIVLLQQTLQKQDTEKLHQKALAAKDEALAALQKLTDECMEKIKALEAREPAAQAPAEANPVAEFPVAAETVTTTGAGATDVEARGDNGAAAKALEAQLDTLRHEATGLRDKLAAAEEQHSSERSALQARVDEAEATVKDLTEGSAGAEAEAVGRLRAQLESVREDLRRRVEDLQAELKGKEDELCYTVEQLSTSAGACDDLRSRCTSLESALAACEKRAVRAEEERGGIQATSAATIDRLLVETKALQQQVDHLTQVGQGAEAEEEKLSRELDGLADANVRLGRDLEQSKASCTALTKKLDKAQGALSSREKELSAATSELSALKVEHSSALQQIDSLKLLVSDAETQVSFAESAKQSVEVQRSEILKAKGELQSQVALKEDTITQLRKELEDIARKNQYLLEEKLNETHVSSTAVITDLHDLLAEKTELVETLSRKLDSALELEKSYLQQIESSAEAIKKLELQVSTEQAQMQDRKTKFKSFVDKLSGEKQAAEAQCASLDKQLKEVADRCASMEADASALRLERDNQAEKFQAELAQREQTLGGLRRSLKAAEEQSRSITEDIRAKYDEDMRLYVARTTEMKGELDELSHKRTTARSELIKMAQSLERASKEGMELKSLFQFTFLPMLQEQVASIQSILVLLESSTNQLLKKASASLQARLKAKAKSSGRVAGARRRPSIGTPDDPDDEDAGASDAATGHVPPSPQAHSSLLSNSSPLHQGGRAALAKRMNIPSINTSGGAAHPHSSSNPMPMLLEYADSCRASLDMLAGGLTLVNTSVEKLHDIVQLDNVTSCAETVGNVISGVISTFAAQPPSITTARGINRREYSTLETDNSTSL